MSKSLYNTENLSPKCEYCANGRPSPDGVNVLCKKMGVVSRDFHCKRFKYDIMKRVPKRAPELQSFEEEDFSL